MTLTGAGSSRIASYEEALDELARFGEEMKEYGTALNAVLVGGIAYWDHLEDGKEPVFTEAKDIDIYVPDQKTVDTIIRSDHGIDVSERYNGGAIYQLGEDREPLPEYADFYRIKYGEVVAPPVVDILTTFNAELEAMLEEDLRHGEELGVPGNVRMVSRDTLIAMKEDAGREKDLEQIASLRATS